MLDSLKNAIYASLGLAVITQEKLKTFVEEWVRRGELTAEQGKKLLDELLARSQNEGRALSDRIAQEVMGVISKSPVVTRRDLRRLEDRVALLERRLGVESPAQGTGAAASDVGPSGAGACGLDEDIGV